MSKNKATYGFTKSAQKQKFVRNRDLKLKDKELRKEDHIRRGMSGGVCDRCREKVQWRFKYNKYKPLKAPGSCQGCRQKTVVKAYRTLCDRCSAQRHCCPSCCVDIVEANKAYALASAAGKGSDVAVTEGDAEDAADDEDDDEVAMDDGEAEGNDSERIEAEMEEAGGSSEAAAAGTGEADLNAKIGLGDVVWDERKFAQYAALKYNKQRPIAAPSEASEAGSSDSAAAGDDAASNYHQYL